MDISTIQGSNAYTANQQTPQPVEDTLSKRQNWEAADLNQDKPRSSQQAFEVTITQEAQDRLAAEKVAISAAQTADPVRGPSPASGSARDASQIVNIVA
ncbi:MAG: hypothetical protein KKF12_08430 [Proteobacteria bacterium]|nr:hypothetical protein [Desulfobacula sp.]MBU3953772.1 hypothetical protein [Pseudomonadota bacterium]MBU4130832.1 hypothetical protein [Pseudomonadota bacterium]